MVTINSSRETSTFASDGSSKRLSSESRDRWQRWITPPLLGMLWIILFVSNNSAASLSSPSNESSHASIHQKPLRNEQTLEQNTAATLTKSVDEQLLDFWQRHQNCSILDTLTNTQTTVFENSSAPTLWVPSYPDSLDDASFRNFISATTGLSSPVKNYYSQNANFRKCHSATSTTLFCTLVHPMVPMGRGGGPTDERPVVFILRNPWTLFPAHSNGKAIRYHGVQGQQTEADWNEFRNAWLENALIPGWKDQIRGWLPPPPCNTTKYNNKNYTIAQWLPMEDFLNPDKGPTVAERLVRIIHETSGYTTPRNDGIDHDGEFFYEVTTIDLSAIPCLWYTSVESYMRTMMQQDYHDYTTNYTPSYTRAQRTLLVQSIQDFRREIFAEYRLLDFKREFVGDKSISKPYPACSLTVDGSVEKVLRELLVILKNYEQDIARQTVVDD